ncbi:glycosyltransferase family 31 protein [Zasmidium cellare ATCC 36951]|uniref:N-acetylgalactosaminide beta-1,3-galactosyltransferase n=1 Tax=Zasmidium cellare ATCC 36951 TaxID=1080233 RepID=A0A6A6D0Z5_ZASCE|nr:glycosyltransferase family 31 protein [Zasmidium cellare ATCC 36951]KAF2172088.1 glycosyltransferase family 31 protein [Zasmidium cellare ATCC 36951]
MSCDLAPSLTHGVDPSNDDYCNTFPDPGNIAIIIKTGATELHAKLPTPLATTLKCVREPLIFSDLEQRLGEHRVHNALANFTPSAMEGNKDFDIYKLQQQYVASGREADLPDLSSISIPSDDWRTEGKSAAWGLDKYKFLHIVEQTWDLAPDRDWYFFIEGDTYISWPNLLKWLNTLDPRQKLYYGNAVRIWEYPKELYFGHGGSGFLLSGAVVKEFAVDRRGLAKRWDKRVHKMWFGDYVLAAALFEELHLRLTDAKPSLTSVDASALTFSEDVFCKPIVTLHHVNSQHLNDMFQFERTLNGSELLYRDVYHGSFPSGMPFNRTNWDNLDEEAELALQSTSEDSENESQEDPHSSYEDCEKACVDNEKCLQFLFVKSIADQDDAEKVMKGECHIMHAVRLGQEHKPEVDKNGKGAGKQWVSGWLRDRIARWIEEHQSCSIGDISWP